MEIQDPHFSKDLLQKILKGDNPPATLETSISINSVYSPESAYKAGFGHSALSSSLQWHRKICLMDVFPYRSQ
jgi:hypothetical protein